MRIILNNYLEETREQKGYHVDPELTAEDWQEVIDGYKEIVKKHTKNDFPQEPQATIVSCY